MITTKRLKEIIAEYEQENLKLKRELREVCCNPESLYAVKVKAEQIYHNWLEEKLMNESTETPNL